MIGRKIRAARALRGWTQDDLAERVGSGWSKQQISAIENAESMTTRTLEAVAEALGMTVVELLSLGEENAASPKPAA